jgi:hypothetical protein
MTSFRSKKSTIFGFIGAFLGRNNDIDGYWAIGKICQAMIESKSSSASVEFVPGHGTVTCQVLGMELPRISDFYRIHFAKWNTNSAIVTIKVFLSGPLAESFDNGRERYQMSVAVDLKTIQRMYNFNFTAHCWPHDPLFESRRR